MVRGRDGREWTDDEIADAAIAAMQADAKADAQVDEPPWPDQAPGESDSWSARYINGAQFVLDAPTDIPAIWGDRQRILWAEGEALMVCGPSGVGKTTVAGQLVAARLGLLDQVLGLPVAPGLRRVLYLAMDRPSQISRSLRRTLRPEWRDHIETGLIVWKGPPPQDFAKYPQWMPAMAKRADADTVIVDSIKDAAIGIADDAVGAGYNRARQATLAAGIEVVELHHQVKRGVDGKPPTTLADVYGSVWLTAGAGSVVLLWGDPGDPIVRLTHLKQPAEEVGPWHVRHDHDTGMSTVEHTPDLVRIAAHTPAGLTATAAAEIIFDTKKPSRAQVEKARRQLDKLAQKGLLVSGKGRAGGADGGTATTWHAATREPS